jgi:hypothetical protein
MSYMSFSEFSDMNLAGVLNKSHITLLGGNYRAITGCFPLPSAVAMPGCHLY